MAAPLAAGPLAHLRVLDLSSLIAGPYCTRLLAALGAEVIKVEEPFGGDPTRHVGPFFGDIPDPEGSAVFSFLNAGKQSVTLDLQDVTGRRMLEELLPRVDIVVESFPPLRRASLGLSHDRWQEIRPDLIITSITYFGQSGPDKDRQASELTLQAEGGYLYTSGDPTREPLKPYGYQAQQVGGLQAALATMAAVFHRRITGKGQMIDVSLEECVAFLLDDGIPWYSYFGEPYRRQGSRVSPTAVRLNYAGNLLPCKDGHVFAAAAQNPQMAAFLFQEPKFESSGYWERAYYNRDEIDEVCANWLQHRTREEAFQEGQELNLVIAPVHTIAEVLENPQLAAREAFIETSSPRGNFVSIPGVPFRMATSKTPQDVRPPSLGEHNRKVFGDLLGLSEPELVDLSNAGIV